MVTKTSSDVTQEINKESTETKDPKYSQEDIDVITLWQQRLSKMKSQRAQIWPELGNLTYPVYYESNRKASMSWSPLRKNETDDRVVTGVTQEKKETILAATLNYNFQPTITPFNEKNTPLQELGDAVEVMIRKAKNSGKVQYNDVQIHLYNEFFAQGNACARVVARKRFDVVKLPKTKTIQDADDINLLEEIDDDLANPWDESLRTGQVTWETKVEEADIEFETQRIPMNALYCGDIRNPFIETQPYMATRYEMSYLEAAKIFKNWKRWGCVPPNMKSFNGLKEDSDQFISGAWTLESVDANVVEILECECVWTNDLVIFINGVLMTAPGYPLTSVNGYCEYTMTKGDCFPLDTPFFYSHGIAAKTKVDQALIDELYRGLAMKMKLSYRPPLANNTGRQLGKRIFQASMITDDIDPDLIKPILPSINGISGPDLQAVQFVKGVIDDKTISPAFQGQITGVSATESVQSKNQTLMRLGLPLFGIIKMETGITMKYIYNILTHWTRKEASGYRKIELDSEFPDGTAGRNIVDFTAMYLEPEQIAAEEGLLSGLYGKPVKKYNINPAILKNIKFKWDVTMTPQEKDADVMKRQAFNASVKDGYAMFTPAAFNQEFLKSQFAQLNKWPKEKAFVQQQPMAPQDPMAMAAQALSPPGENGINNAIGNMVPRQGAAAPPPPEELMKLLK